MSKRFSHLCKITAALCAALALLLLVSQPAQAGNTVVRIDESFGAFAGQSAYVSITLDNHESLRSFGGFDFLIAFDASALTLQEVIPRELIDSCGWEYFTYRIGAQGNCGGPCPSGFVRLLAIAEEANPMHPSCFFSGMSGKLATLKFLGADSSLYNGVFVPIRFYWLDCSNNVFASTTGDTLYFSHRVYDFPLGSDITGQPGYGGWQGIEGSPNCLNLQGSPPDTAVDFYNGGVHVINQNPVDARGDLNLNGISYEIADMVVFTNYFLHGLDALPAISRDTAIAASDVNVDGIDLTYQDAVYLYRIIIGDALPYHKQAAGASADAYFQQDSTNHRVVVNCNLPLAGAFMLMRGNVTPTFLIPQAGWGQYTYYDGTYTRMLIIGDPNQPFGNGVWFTYQGTGKLESVETTDWHNAAIASHIIFTATNCGDFDGSGSINIADAVYIIRYIFSGGLLPVDPHAGDVNCDNTCNISDIVYLLAYIFSGGPAPCENCK